MSPVSVAVPAGGPRPGVTSVSTCTAVAKPHGWPASARRFISATEVPGYWRSGAMLNTTSISVTPRPVTAISMARSGPDPLRCPL
jgi:hypothetical protein